MIVNSIDMSRCEDPRQW